MLKVDTSQKLELTKEEMKDYGYRVVDAIVSHFDTQNQKLPVAAASRQEMDRLFLEDVPEKSTDAHQVLNFVLENVMTQSNIVSHPKSYAFRSGSQ